MSRVRRYQHETSLARHRTAERDAHRTARTYVDTDAGPLAPGPVGTGTTSALTGSDDPTSAASLRPYGRRGGLRPPLAAHQTDLETWFPRDATGNPLRTPDPRATWFRLANDGGPTADPTRALNCQDCVLSFYDSWVHGRPRVSAPRTFDTHLEGDPTHPTGGETDGPSRAEKVTGGRYQSLLLDVTHVPAAEAKTRTATAYASLETHLRTSGHGSMAMIINGRPDGSSHAWAAVNQHGTILWVDPQRGAVSEHGPLYLDVTRVDTLTLGPDGKPAPVNGRPPGSWSAGPWLDDPTRVLGRPTPPPPPGEASGPEAADTPAARRQQRLAAQAQFAASGRSARSVLDAATGLAPVFEAGAHPLDVAKNLDTATLSRLFPELPPEAVERTARFFAGPQVRQMVETAWTDAPAVAPMLAEQLITELPHRQQLLSILERSPELYRSLLARPLTLHNLAKHQEAIDVVEDAVADIEAGRAEEIAARTPVPEPTRMSDRHRQVSLRAQQRRDGQPKQAHFDTARRRDGSYVAGYVADLYRSAVGAQADLSAVAERIAARHSGRKAASRPVLKDLARSMDKVAEYQGDASQLLDVAGAKVLFRNLDDLYDGLEQLAADSDVAILRVKDRFSKPLASGCRDILMNLGTGNGHVGELRLHLAEMDGIAEWDHALYEVRRDVEALAAEQGRQLTVREVALRNGILKREQIAFWRALTQGDGGD